MIVKIARSKEGINNKYSCNLVVYGQSQHCGEFTRRLVNINRDNDVNINGTLFNKQFNLSMNSASIAKIGKRIKNNEPAHKMIIKSNGNEVGYIEKYKENIPNSKIFSCEFLRIQYKDIMYRIYDVGIVEDIYHYYVFDSTNKKMVALISYMEDKETYYIYEDDCDIYAITLAVLYTDFIKLFNTYHGNKTRPIKNKYILSKFDSTLMGRVIDREYDY